MSCFKERVHYDWRGVIILLTLQMKVKKNLPNIATSGKKILKYFKDLTNLENTIDFNVCIYIYMHIMYSYS